MSSITLNDLQHDIAAVLDPSKHPRQTTPAQQSTGRSAAVTVTIGIVTLSVALGAWVAFSGGTAGACSAAASAAVTLGAGCWAALGNAHRLIPKHVVRAENLKRARNTIRVMYVRIHTEQFRAAAVALTDNEFQQLCCSALEYFELDDAVADAAPVTAQITLPLASKLTQIIVAASNARDAAAGTDELAVRPLNIADALLLCTPANLPASERWEMVQRGRVAATACGGATPSDTDGSYLRTPDGSTRTKMTPYTTIDWPWRWSEYRRLEAAGPAAVEVAAGLYPTMHGGLANIVDTAIAVVARPTADA